MPVFVSISQYITTVSGVVNAILVFTLLVVYRYRCHAIGTRRRKDLIQPKGTFPLLGHLPLLASVPGSQFFEFLQKQYMELGPVWSISIAFYGRVIYINSVENIDHILKTNFPNYIKGPLFTDLLFDIMGSGGIATSEGATWKFQRKLTSQIYSTKAFHEYTSDVFVEQAKKVVDHLGTAADQGEVIDFQSLFIKYTLGCLGAIAFGNDFGCLDNIKDEIPFVASYGYLLALCSKRMFNPVWKIHERWTGVSEKVKHHRELLRGCALEIIQKRRKENCSVHKKDLLQLLLESSDDSGSPLSDDLVIDNILTFLLAGHESTASTMTWMIYSIYKDGTDYHIAAALVQEIDDVLRGLDPTYQTHKKQKFAEACWNEAARLYPALPRNLRTCVQDDILPDGTRVFAGELVSWSSYVMGRSEPVWGSDAKEFKPSRWINSERPSTAKFNTFNHGPRICPGQNFAIIEGLTAISMILQSFDVSLVNPSEKRTYATSLSLPMLGPLNIQVSRRKEW